MSSNFISPRLASQIEALGASIRCLDSIEHHDLLPLKLEVCERMLATSEQLKPVLANGDISQIRPLVISYAELESFINPSMGPLQSLHHRIHIRDDSNYCLEVAQFACSDTVRAGLKNALDTMRNPEGTNPIHSLIAKLLGR